MSPPNLHTLPSEILKAILEEVFAGSQIRIALCEKNDPAVISDAILEHFAAFAHLVGSESPILPWLVRSKRRPQASSPALQFVASALNNDFGPLIVCRRLYQESFDLFWQRTVFVLEGPVTADDLCDWIPELWKLHIAHVQMEGSHVLSRELKGTRGFERLEQLCLRDASLDAPPIIHEIYDQTDQELHEMILLCRAECLRDIAYPRRTMANLAALVPSVNIVMSFPVAVYYIGDYTETFGGWLPDIDVEIHTKPSMVYLNGLTLSEYKKTYVRPSDEAALQETHDMNNWRYHGARRNGLSGMIPFAVMDYLG